MRIKEVAKALEVSADWLRRLERAGKIPAASRDLNGHRRYTAAEVDALRRLIFNSGVPEDGAKWARELGLLDDDSGEAGQ